MKFVSHLIAVLLLSWLLQSFLPWWTMAIGAFAIGLVFRQSGFLSFLAGLLGVGLLWYAMAWHVNSSADSVLGGKVALIFSAQSAGFLMIGTALVGGLVGGLASMTGGLVLYKRKAKY